MKFEDIRKIAVVGAGTMGAGIAQLAAQAGYNVLLYDLEAGALEKAKAKTTKNLDGAIKRGKISAEDKPAILDRMAYTSKFEDIKADVIIEAIVEKTQVKRDLFEKLIAQNAPDAIMATNTSSIPITRIAVGQQNPERFVGMHFFNPAHIMKLVEIISGAATAKETAALVYQLAEKMGKKPVNAKDAPGFIVNRVARHFYVEALQVAEEQVSDFETIDRLLEGQGFKMGPFTLMDLIGVDTNFSVTSSLFESFHYDEKFRPNRIQEQKVQAGHHGRKSGRGFYSYENE